MPDNAGGFPLWIQEVTTELKDRKEKHDQLRIDFTKLETEVHTKDSANTNYGDKFWKIFSVLIAVSAVVVAIMALIKH